MPNNAGKGDPLEALRLEVSALVAAKPSTVFRYLVDPERFSRWLGAQVAIDPRPGGKLRIDFAQHRTIVAGEVVEVVPDHRVVFTWGVESGPQAATMPVGSTRVTVQLEPTAEGTRVTIRHEGLPNAHERDEHRGGWEYYLVRLDIVALEDGLRAVLAARLDDYFEAWATLDADRRQAALDRCWAHHGAYLDRHGRVMGREALARHIAGLHQMGFGARLEPRGEASMALNHVRFGWVLSAPDGSTLGSGENVGELDAEGRFVRVVGFWDD